MALHEVIQKLDFRQPAQRLLASSACIGLGALAAYQGTTTTPAGLLAGVLGVIGANVLSTDLHGAVTRRLGRAKQVFRNHDLTQVVGKAIGLVIEKVAEDPRLSGEQSGLRSLAKAAPGYWDTIAPLTATDEALEPLSEPMLLQFVAVTADDFEATTALDQRTWVNFVQATAEVARVTLRPSTFPRVASELYLQFPTALREVLKADFSSDGRAYAGLQMLLWGELLTSLNELKQDNAGRDAASQQAYADLLDEMANGLNRLQGDFQDFVRREVLDEMTSIVHALQQEVRDGFAENRALHGVTHDRLDEITDRLDSLFEKLESPLPADPAYSVAVTKPPYVSTVPMPPRNPRFLKRLDRGGYDILTALHKEPKKVHRVVLHGMPGVGKTQAALEYAHHYSDDRKVYKEVYWTVGGTLDQFLIGLSGIAQRLGLPVDRPPVEILGAIHRGLEESSDWLWVIDNASNPALIAREYLPNLDSGRILITTTRREPELRSIGAMTVELTSFFDHAAGARFLAGLLREGGTIEELNEDDRQAAEEISEEVSGLPLALDQAAAYIEHTGSSPRSYLAEYRRRGPILRNTRTPLKEEERDHPAVTRTFSMLFDLVEAQNEASADLLRLCAFLSADAIPEELLALGAPELGSPLGPAVEESLPMTQIPALRARLVEVNPDSKTIRVHRVVQDVIRDLMDQPDRDRWAERAVRAVNRAVPEVGGFEQEHLDRYIPHLETCARIVIRDQMKFPEAGRLLDKTGRILRYGARFAESLSFLGQALAITEAARGRDHPDTARSLNNLAALLQDQGKYNEAEPLYRRALQIRETMLGSDHPDTALSLGNLAGLFQGQGRYNEAEPLFKQALQIRETKLGPDHPDTATSLNNLAGLLRAQGKYNEAEPLFKRALQIRETKLGPDHPDTATSLNNLALLFHYQERYNEVVPLYRRALQIHETKLGPDHPDTATSLNNLAALLQDQGKYNEAEPLFQRALQIRETKLGPDHPDTATSLNNLAGLLQDQGKYNEAEPLYRRALQIHETKLGPDHPDTAISLDDLAGLFQDQERYNEAAPLYRRALQIHETKLGPDHPDTAISLGNLATLLQAQGKYDAADPLYRRALQIHETKLGPDHPDTATSLNNLAGLLRAQGKYNEAEPLFRRAWEVVRNVLGPHHPSSVQVLKNYLFVLRLNGRNTEYKSVLSKIDPSRAKDVKQAVDARIKADQRRRGL